MSLLALILVNLVLVAGNVTIAFLNASLLKRLRRHEIELLRQITQQRGIVPPHIVRGSGRIRA